VSGPRAIFAIALAAVVAAAMATACRPAHAAELAYLQNQAGGQIVLTDVPVDACGNGAIAFARAPSGRTMYGCWVPGERFITIEWSTGRLSTYPVADFTLYRATDHRQLQGI
jgi:hypothetical protein